MTDIILIVTSVLLAIGGQIFMKKGMTQIGVIHLSNLAGKFLPMFLNVLVIAGLFLYALSAVLWLIILSRKDLSFAYPLVSMGYVLVLILSSVIFKEHVSMLRWAGAMVIVAGIILISRS